MAEILLQCSKLEKNEPTSEQMQIITPVYAQLGEKAYGTSAGQATVHFTIRCWNNDRLESLQKDIENLATKTAKKHKLKIGFEYTETFYANENDSKSVQLVRSAANKEGITLIEKEHPFKWGEDFGMFTTKYTGCMFGLGAGKNYSALHNPDYDFPDTITPTGIKIFYNIIKELTNV